jgi:hypothetical protein
VNDPPPHAPSAKKQRDVLTLVTGALASLVLIGTSLTALNKNVIGFRAWPGTSTERAAPIVIPPAPFAASSTRASFAMSETGGFLGPSGLRSGFPGVAAGPRPALGTRIAGPQRRVGPLAPAVAPTVAPDPAPAPAPTPASETPATPAPAIVPPVVATVPTATVATKDTKVPATEEKETRAAAKSKQSRNKSAQAQKQAQNKTHKQTQKAPGAPGQIAKTPDRPAAAVVPLTLGATDAPPMPAAAAAPPIGPTMGPPVAARGNGKPDKPDKGGKGPRDSGPGQAAKGKGRGQP